MPVSGSKWTDWTAGSPPRGFGTRLIERTVRQELKGDVRIEFAQSGLVCKLRVPVVAQGCARPEPQATEGHLADPRDPHRELLRAPDCERRGFGEG
jgi:hypothetical protein